MQASMEQNGCLRYDTQGFILCFVLNNQSLASWAECECYLDVHTPWQQGWIWLAFLEESDCYGNALVIVTNDHVSSDKIHYREQVGKSITMTVVCGWWLLCRPSSAVLRLPLLIYSQRNFAMKSDNKSWCSHRVGPHGHEWSISLSPLCLESLGSVLLWWQNASPSTSSFTDWIPLMSHLPLTWTWLR